MSQDSIESDAVESGAGVSSRKASHADTSGKLEQSVHRSDTTPISSPTTESKADSVQTSLLAYQTALELASSARTLSQSAISPDDWSLVASRWSRAADQLKLVSTDSEHYQQAQQKMADYTQNAVQTRDRIQRLQTETYVPLPASPAVSVPLSPPVSSIPTTSNGYAASQNRVRVPIVRRLHGTPVVKVTFNGTKQYEMILDTGASRTLITRQMANDLEVEITSQMLAATASAAEVTFDIGQIRTITMGSLTLSNVSVGVGDAVSVGLLGNDFFSGHDVIIRSREGMVELVKS
ncbi:MAG: retropepsin-like aspartic protease [Cyanobacteria bacterium P01_D01_bin.1]